MSRDQRVQDNWALLEAQAVAIKNRSPLSVVFCLAPQFNGAPMRAYRFMLAGLEETAAELARLGISFSLLSSRQLLPTYLRKIKAGLVVCDFSPLRDPIKWKKELVQTVDIAVIEVDAHNVVPAWIASGKAEIGARTLRPKIKRLLGDALTPIPPVTKHPVSLALTDLPGIGFEEAWGHIQAAETAWTSVPFISGTNVGMQQVQRFLDRLRAYAEKRNDPTCDAQSGLSPWLHFGQISAQRVALEVLRSGHDEGVCAPFLEELIVRKELADNFCLYRPNYDSVGVFPAWASASLQEHLLDERPYLYDQEALEKGETHDALWNAAQRQMLITGKMHGWVRMYWGKKILEWSKTPKDALKNAMFLNDRYSLDGRDPNGYAGIAWSIGAIHDRAWPSRPIYGKVRTMTQSGARRKFDVDAYIRHVSALSEGAPAI